VLEILGDREVSDSTVEVKERLIVQIARRLGYRLQHRCHAMDIEGVAPFLI
jgi:hypothetical protein